MAPVTGAQLPFMGDYKRRQRDYQLAYERAKATIASRRAEIFNRYGFQGAYGDKGQLTGVRPDAANVTGEYQQQRRAHFQDLRDLRADQATRGFKGGLLGQEQNQLRYFQGVEDTNLMRTVLGQASELSQALAMNQFDFSTAQSDLLEDAINQAIESRQFTPAVLEELEGAAGGTKGDVPGIFYRDRFFQSNAQLADFLERRRKGSRLGILRRWQKDNPKRARKLTRMSPAYKKRHRKRRKLSGPFPGGASTPGPR